MSTLIDIQNQIEKLQKQANDIKVKEFEKTVQEILAKMRAFGITAKDLKTAESRAGRSKAAAPMTGTRSKQRKKSTVAVAARYRGPNGETWSGRGLTPRWLAALVSQGRKKEEFVIQP